MISANWCHLQKVRMQSSIFLILALTLLAPSGSVAQAMACEQLFEKTYKATEFIIYAKGKKQSKNYLELAHENLTSTLQLSNLTAVLKQIKHKGIEDLTKEERKFIIKFRQNSSFLRSMFQTSDESHASPKEFANFVRDFGVLKDYLLMNDEAGASQTAKIILKKYKNIDFDSLLKDITPASKKSVKKYFKAILHETKEIMAKSAMTYDEIHDVRKNLRDVLRYMQITNEVAHTKATSGKFKNLNQAAELQDTVQMEFLKKINEKLGEICDENAARLLRAEISENTLTEFPEKIRPRVEYFLDHFQIQITD